METASLMDKPTDCGAQPYTPSPAELEAGEQYRRERSVELALRAASGPITAHHLIENSKLICAYIAGESSWVGKIFVTPDGAGVIDAEATQPDGTKIYRVNDHWFDARYLTNT